MSRWIVVALVLTVGLLATYVGLTLREVLNGTDAIEDTLKVRLIGDATAACNAAAHAQGRSERFTGAGLSRAHFVPWQLILTSKPAAEIVRESGSLACRYDFSGSASVYARETSATGP